MMKQDERSQGRAATWEPRPVGGQREYSIVLEGNARVVQDAVANGRKLIEEAGAVVIQESGDRTAFLLETARGQFPIELRSVGQRARALQLRARPDELDQSNYWPPKEVRTIAARVVEAHELYDGPTRLLARPVHLAPIDLRRWTDDVLLSPDRQLPMVVLTPGRHTSADAAAELASDLAGIANVYVIDDADAARQWSYSITKERGVFGGAVRVYRAGFTAECDPLDHDLLVPGYLDRRLALGRSLGEEIARRILPHRAEPIERPRPAPSTPAILPLPTLPRRKRPEERLRELEEHIEAIEQRNEELEEENRRLNAALRAQAERLRALESPPARSATELLTIPGIPWPLENAEGYDVELGDLFSADLAKVARDGGLADEVRKKMESVLRHPEDYGKDMRGARHGQRACYVARNYRLVWSVEGKKVRFVLIVSKEDPEYSPHGA
jgi:vacuolar-type H+-ATPase subunit F/Vma7